MSRTFSTDDVATHNTPDSLWVIIDQHVYDVTKFQKDHPGKFNNSLPVIQLITMDRNRGEEDTSEVRRQGCVPAV